MYVGSQWFTISKAFAEYLLTDTHFVPEYTDYARHAMVADENFFATVIKNSPFCHTHVNYNNVHVQFDQWEHDKVGRNPAKCLMPNPDHCGRSPTINTLETLPTLELSGEPFARKFDSDVDSAVLDAIDVMRREESASKGAADATGGYFFRDVSIAIASSRPGSPPLCVHMGPTPVEPVVLRQCRRGEDAQSFEVGPCSSDGTLALEHGRPMRLEPGRFSRPFCPVKSAPHQLCLDLEGEGVEEGTSMISYQCGVKWNQLFSFGRDGVDGESAGHLFINVPFVSHQSKRLCLQADSAEENARVRVADCRGNEARQRFVFREKGKW